MSAANSQNATKGGIQGTVTDSSGAPLVGAYAVATGVGTTPHLSHTVLISSNGQFSFAGLDPGQYQVCINAPGAPQLDPCHWSKPATITVANGAVTQNQTITTTKGALLQVRINDPLRLLDSSKQASDLVVGVLLPRDLFEPMRLASTDALGRTYDLAIPSNASVKLQVHSSHLQLNDEAGLSLAPSTAAITQATGTIGLAAASTLTVQVPAGSTVHQVTLTVTGKK